MAKDELAYHTAYEKDGTKLCPECGVDLEGWHPESVLAHSTSHWEKIDSHESFDEARRRQGILAKIAKEASK
jgi:hypothetical protein